VISITFVRDGTHKWSILAANSTLQFWCAAREAENLGRIDVLTKNPPCHRSSIASESYFVLTKIDQILVGTAE